MKTKISVLSASALLFVIPMMVQAATVGGFINKVKGWLSALVPMMITLGVLAFFWGLFNYLKSGDVEDKGKGMNIMVMGILAVFVMASLGGLVSILQKTTGAGENNRIQAPCIDGVCGGNGRTRN